MARCWRGLHGEELPSSCNRHRGTIPMHGSPALTGRCQSRGNKMNQHIRRSCLEPQRTDLSWVERWDGPDKGVIYCWEVGRELARTRPDLAERAKKGELPILAWKGGVEKEVQKKKCGSLFYLAQWQGLRGQDLDVDLAEETKVICSRTGVTVLFTGNAKKYEKA